MTNLKLKRMDMEISYKSKPIGDNIKLPKYLWQANNIRSTVMCQNCHKPRLIFAWRSQNIVWKQSLENLYNVIQDPLYDYTCGDALFGISENAIQHPLNTSIFHVRRFLTCNMPVEKIYFQCSNKTLCTPVYSVCGEKTTFVNEQCIMKKTNNKKAYPICIQCFDDGKDPITYGRNKSKIAKNNKRIRGDAYSENLF